MKARALIPYFIPVEVTHNQDRSIQKAFVLVNREPHLSDVSSLPVFLIIHCPDSQQCKALPFATDFDRNYIFERGVVEFMEFQMEIGV